MLLVSATQPVNTCRKHGIIIFEEEAKIRIQDAVKWFILEL
jgi:hypothetical protein